MARCEAGLLTRAAGGDRGNTRSSRGRLRAALVLAAWGVAACDVNPFDASQLPRVEVTVSAGTTPAVTIAWQPEGAELVRVYRGATTGDGYTANLVWSIAATSANSLTSGVVYGATTPTGGRTDVPAKLLVPGEIYTVQVTRRDPRGRGDGFTNTRNAYMGTASFTAPTP